jgi:hypothetical protein
VTTEDAIAALSRHWADVAGHLRPEQLRELRGLVADLGGPAHEDAMARVADFLEATLPPGHPVTEALFEGHLSAAATLDWPVITDRLRAEIEAALAGVREAQEPDAGPRPGDDILRSVADRVLQAPAFTAEQVREHGGDPGDSCLLRLERADGSPQWPAFQFPGLGGPYPVIRPVNELLQAAADPVAAADWWLSHNFWLGDQPSVLIGRVPDDYLVRAARAVAGED